MKYCWTSGLSSPWAALNAATIFGSDDARSPSAAVTGLAGTRFVSTKVTTVTPMSSRNEMSSRIPR